MLHTFRSNARFRSRLEFELGRIARGLDRDRVDSLDLTSLLVEPTATDRQGGSKPICELRGTDGRRYFFKTCESDLAGAEEAAYRLRKLGGRPAVPTRAIDAGGEGPTGAGGSLQPFVELTGVEALAGDTTQWTERQRAVMLLEHAWEWWLDNLDANASQYALFGPERLPVNVDWDRAFATDGTSEMSRFAKYRSTLPNARTLLYADYVAGKVKLPLWLLAREARHIARLPEQPVRGILERYAAAHHPQPAERDALVARLLRRQNGIEGEVGTLMRSLWAERRRLSSPPDGPADFAYQRLSWAWARWQLVLNAVRRGPVGKAGRGLLTLVRGLRARARVSSSG